MKLRRLAALALVIGALCAGCSKSNSTAGPQGPPPLAVDVGTAVRQTIATYLALDGQITPLQESTLGSQQAGMVTAVNVLQGDRVTKGQLLAKIDDSTLRAQLATNEALVTQAKARLASSNLTNPITVQQSSSGVIQAERALSTARAAFENAKIVYRSNESLYKQGYVAQTTFEQARAAYVAAQDGVTNAQSALDLARRNTGQTQIQQQDIEANRGALDQAVAQVKLLEAQIEQSNIYAPFDGVVTARLLDPGAQAGPNQPILRVSEIDHVFVTANVPDEDLHFVEPGTPATFTTPSLPGRKFTGRIRDLNATPTAGTLSYQARIIEANPDERLRGGMLVTMTVRKEQHDGVIVVPKSAVVDSEHGAAVFTVADGKAKLVPVTVGLQTDTQSEVAGAGIEPGTNVITTRPEALQNGSVVMVANAGAGSPAKENGGAK